MRKLLIIILLVSRFAHTFSQDIVDYTSLSPEINLLPYRYDETIFLFSNKNKETVLEVDLESGFKAKKLDLDKKDLERIFSLESTFYTPYNKKNYCMERTWGKKEYEDAWYELLYEKNNYSFYFKKYLESSYGGINTAPQIYDSSNDYWLIYNIEYSPMEGAHYELLLKNSGSISIVMSGAGSTTFNYIGNNLVVVEEGYRTGGDIGWEDQYETYILDLKTNMKLSVFNEKIIGFGSEFYITTNNYQGFNIYNNKKELVYREKNYLLLDILNSVGFTTVHKAFRFNGRYITYDICFPQNSLESYRTVVMDLKENRSYITNENDINLLGIF